MAAARASILANVREAASQQRGRDIDFKRKGDPGVLGFDCFEADDGDEVLVEPFGIHIETLRGSRKI